MRNCRGKLENSLIIDLAKLGHALSGNCNRPNSRLCLRTARHHIMGLSRPRAEACRYQQYCCAQRAFQCLRPSRPAGRTRITPRRGMDHSVKKQAKPAVNPMPTIVKRPSQSEAEAAVRTLIAWAGDDPAREGVRDTPRRVVEAFSEYFSGYRQDPAEVLARTFEDV